MSIVGTCIWLGMYMASTKPTANTQPTGTYLHIDNAGVVESQPMSECQKATHIVGIAIEVPKG